MNSQKIRSQKHVAKQRKRRWRRLAAFVVAIVILFAGLAGLSHWSAVQINSFTVETQGSDLPEKEMREVVSNQLEQKLWFVFDRNNVLLLPNNRIAQQITGMTPRIQSTDVDLTGLQSFTVNIQTRQPVAKVCPLQAATTTSCLLVDKQGFVYRDASNEQQEGGDLFVYRANNLPDISTQIKPDAVFSVLESFLDKLPELSFKPLSATLKSHGDVFINTKNSTATSTTAASTVKVRVNLADDLSRKFADLKTVVEKESFVASSTEETINGSASSISPFSLEYIDLRFGNKVFYR